MSNLSKLTIVIPCHLDNDKFRRALHSAQWAEVLIINQNSDTKWSELKQQYEFEKFDYPVLKSFSEMKNTALKKVKTEWVFFLDSDEWIDDQLKNELVAKLSDTSCDGFSIKRIDYFLGDWVTRGEIANQLQTRIGRTSKVHWTGDVHETLQVHGEVERLQSYLYHEPHDSIHDFIQSVNQYTTQLSERKKGSGTSLLLESEVWPIGKFIWNYFIRLGFLDGWRGFIYSFTMSLHSKTVRIKAYEQNK